MNDDLRNRTVSAEQAGFKEDDMMAPHGHPDHKCSADFVYEMRFTGQQLHRIHEALMVYLPVVDLSGRLAIQSGDVTADEVVRILESVVDIAEQISATVGPRIKEQLAREAKWEEFNIGK